MPSSARRVVVVRSAAEAKPGGVLPRLTPEERLAQVWPLTCDAYAFVPGFDPEQRLPRHVVRVVRRGR